MQNMLFPAFPKGYDSDKSAESIEGAQEEKKDPMGGIWM